MPAPPTAAVRPKPTRNKQHGCLVFVTLLTASNAFAKQRRPGGLPGWQISQLETRSIRSPCSIGLLQIIIQKLPPAFVVLGHHKQHSMHAATDHSSTHPTCSTAAAPAPAVPAEVAYEQYVNLDAFKSQVLPLLHQDIARNTLVLTQLGDNSNASTLSTLSCSSCSISTVVVAGDNKGLGYSACYVSAGPCKHIAGRLASVLQQQLLHCEKVTMTAAAAQLLSEAQPAAHRWQLDHQLQLMVYSAGSLAPTTSHPDAPADSAALSPHSQPCPQQSQHQQHPQQHQHQGLQLRQCTADTDAAWVVSWATAFLQEVFDMPAQPTEQQVGGAGALLCDHGWL